MPKTWFITGCSTGFGRLLAEELHARGDRVVATARQPESLEDLGRNDEGRILRRGLDVRDRWTIADAVDATRAKFGEIDVLVNNAGYGYFSTQEEGDLGEIRSMFETNVFGLVAMTQAVLPRMRERRSGTIVNLSSIAGWIGTPRSGFYQASKWAVEALSESLFHEVSGFGIRVISIQPGLFGTRFQTSARTKTPEEDAASPYSGIRETWRRNFSAKFFTEVQDASEVVDAILRAVDGDVPFLRVPVGRDSRVLVEKRAELGDAGFVTWLNRELYDGD